MKEKIGVYICHCGGNISDYVDVNKVREIVEKEEGVAIAKDTMFACADSTQKEIIDDIKEHQLDAIVIASCSPKLHLFTFRNVAERAGLNPYNYVQANIREQCSWAHTDKPKEATDKAIRLVRAAIARVKYSEALTQIEISAINAVLIVGAGVSGMRAAIDAADMGSDVYLVEQSHFVGGRTAQMGELFSTNENGKKIVEKLYNEVKKREKIKLFTGAEVDGIKGSVGEYSCRIKISPRYIKKEADLNKLKNALREYSGEDFPDSFNFGLTQRKALYMDYDNAFPVLPAIDKENFKPGDDFLEKYKDCFDLSQQEEILNINIGAVLVNTGFDPYEPKAGEYGYKTINEVVTLQQLKRLIELNDNQLIYNNKPVKNLVFIYCVGSRQTEGENKYCSRYCCTSAIHTSLLLHEKYNNIQSYHLYRDIRTYGKQELLYDESSLKGDIFSKFDADEPPVVENVNGKPRVKFNDLLFDNEEFEITPDLVVLVTGMVPRKDSTQVAGILKTPVGSDKFFNEVHPKLRPVETVIDGMYISGTCQGPKNITETVNSALSAAAKANALISSGKIELEPTVIKVNPETCECCDKCADICPYNALSKTKSTSGKEIAEVNIAVCKGCGMCAPVCPKDAIEIVGYTNNEIESMIDGLIKEIE